MSETLDLPLNNVEEWLGKAREAYDYRNKRLADLTDDAVDASALSQTKVV